MDKLFDTFEHQIFSIFLAFIIWDIGMFLFFYFQAKKFVDNSRNTTATIIKLEKTKGSKGSIALAATFSFQDQMNKEIIANLQIVTNKKGEFKEGDKVKILYLKNQPSKIALASKVWGVAKISGYCIVMPLGILIYMMITGMAKMPF